MAGSGAKSPKVDNTKCWNWDSDHSSVDGGKWRTTEAIDLTHSILDGLRGSRQQKANQRWLPR
eukprot:1414431-Amphidinium_carterae.2